MDRAVARLRAAAILGAGLTAHLAVGPHALPLTAQTPGAQERIDGFRADLEELRARLGIPGLSVAVARDGEVLWAEGLGWADVEARRPATPETPYRIASITKTMTATVLAGLDREGSLDLDAPLARVMDGGPPWFDEVTLRHVLTHTSESRPPGRAFAYSGRYDALASVAAETAGRPFSELLVERILEPAGMSRSYPVSLSSSERARGVRAELATPYFVGGDPAPDGVIPERTVGGNGVVSTVLDLIRWVDALENGRVLEPAVLEELWTAGVTPAGDTLSYGLGWWVEETPALRLVFHGGQWPVYSGLLLHVRGADLTLAILADHQGVSHPFYGIGTGTALYSTFAASFLRRFALDDVWREGPPELPWDVPVDSLRAVVEAAAPGAARHHLGAELFGRGLVARASADTARADSLLRIAMECCPSALEASDDLGLLFHLGRSGDPELRELGREAGRRRLERFPGEPTTRFNLAVSHVQAGGGERAEALLRGLLDDRDEIPRWMWSWSAYLLAEVIAEREPGEARRLLERVLAEGAPEPELEAEVRRLLDGLTDGPR